MINFKIKGEKIELSKLLKATGLAESGGAAKHAVTSGLVSVNGNIETKSSCKIKINDQIEFNQRLSLWNPVHE